jgi:hypothetical protein
LGLDGAAGSAAASGPSIVPGPSPIASRQTSYWNCEGTASAASR